jgi:hypothetical protein
MAELTLRHAIKLAAEKQAVNPSIFRKLVSPAAKTMKPGMTALRAPLQRTARVSGVGADSASITPNPITKPSPTLFGGKLYDRAVAGDAAAKAKWEAMVPIVQRRNVALTGAEGIGQRGEAVAQVAAGAPTGTVGRYYPNYNMAVSNYPRGTRTGRETMRHELMHGVQANTADGPLQSFPGLIKYLNNAKSPWAQAGGAMLGEVNSNAAMARSSNPLQQIRHGVGFLTSPADAAAYALVHKNKPFGRQYAALHGGASAAALTGATAAANYGVGSAANAINGSPAQQPTQTPVP